MFLKMKKRGFTLLEMLLSVSIIVIITSITVPVYFSLKIDNDLNIAQNIIVTGLRRAQILARASKNDSDWGVHMQTNSITIFNGTSYAARVTTFDEDFDTPNTVTFSNLSEIVFSKFTGLPTTTGQIDLTANNNATAQVAINAQGEIDY